jgi:glycerol-3-phosphate dehydrogenase
LTTYRKISAEAADLVAGLLGIRETSSTETVELAGANGAVDALQRRLRDAGAAESVIDPSIKRYGAEVITLANLMNEDVSLSEPLSDGRTSAADVVYAVRHEAASRISDITLRRTHLAWFTRDHARADAEIIGTVMQRELSWSSEQLAAELAAHEAELAAEGL